MTEQSPDPDLRHQMTKTEEALIRFARACGITEEGLQDHVMIDWLADQAATALQRKWASEDWEARARSLEAVLAILRAEIVGDRWDPRIALARIEAALAHWSWESESEALDDEAVEDAVDPDDAT